MADRAALFVHVTARPWKVWGIAAALAAHHLVERYVVASEGIGTTREVHAPDTELLVAYKRFCFLRARFEVVCPKVQRACIVVTQALNIERLQSTVLHGLESEAQMRQIATGKYVAVYEASGCGFRRVRIGQCDTVIHRNTVVGEQITNLAEVGGQVAAPDVLVHPDAGNAIELPSHIAIVQQADIDDLLQSCRFDARRREIELILR